MYCFKVEWAVLGTDESYHSENFFIPITTYSSDLGVSTVTFLKFHHHIQLTAKNSAGIANNFLRSTVNQDASFMLPLFRTHIYPITDFSS